MSVIHINEEQAEEIMWTTHISKRTGDKHRWHTDEWFVFEQDGKFYEFLYMEPATEMQEGQDVWEDYYGEQIPCYEVIPVQKTTTVYERV